LQQAKQIQQEITQKKISLFGKHFTLCGAEVSWFHWSFPLIRDGPFSFEEEQEMTPNDREWLSVKEAVAYTTLSRLTLRRRVREGVLPCAKTGRRVLFCRADLDAYLRSCAVIGAEKGGVA
jgi:excisionase family DNA binding protein